MNLSNQSFLLRQISYSSRNEFRSCERKYQLDKMSARSGESTVDLAFGSAVGAGVQSLWLTGGDFEKALWAAFQAWDTDFADEVHTKKKSIAFAAQAIHNYLPIYHILSQDWTLPTINDVPAVEFSLKIELPNGFIYRAFTDLILQNKETEELAVVELKTTADNYGHEAKYKNSDQGTGYALLIDHLSPNAAHFWVKYFVYHSRSMEWIPYDFPKALIDKVRWLRTTLKDIKDIERCEEENYFPMRGANCMAFGKACRYFDTCQLRDEAHFSSEQVLQEKVEKEKKETYSFVIPIEHIIENYLKP